MFRHVDCIFLIILYCNMLPVKFKSIIVTTNSELGFIYVLHGFAIANVCEGSV